MNRLTVYLAGAMSGLTYKEMNQWRKNVKKEFKIANGYYGTDVKIINPVDYYNYEEIKHQTEMEVMAFDLYKVRHSNILVINTKGLNSSIGTAIEIYEAYKRNIPVIALDENNIYEELHPWLQCCISRHENTIHDLTEYIMNFYVN